MASIRKQKKIAEKQRKKDEAKAILKAKKQKEAQEILKQKKFRAEIKEALGFGKLVIKRRTSSEELLNRI